MRMTFSHPLPKKALTNFENLLAARRNQLGNNNNNNKTSNINNNVTVESDASGLKQNASISSAISPSSSSSAAQPLQASSYGVMKKNATGKGFIASRY